jgi:hypothetical protein
VEAGARKCCGGGLALPSHNSGLFAVRKKRRWHPTAKTADRSGLSFDRRLISEATAAADNTRLVEAGPGHAPARSMVHGDDQQQLAGSALGRITADSDKQKY